MNSLISLTFVNPNVRSGGATAGLAGYRAQNLYAGFNHGLNAPQLSFFRFNLRLAIRVIIAESSDEYMKRCTLTVGKIGPILPTVTCHWL